MPKQQTDGQRVNETFAGFGKQQDSTGFQHPIKRLDGLLVSALPNVRYLTGFSGSNALVVVSELA